MTHNFNDVIDDMKRRTKAGELPRETRIVEKSKESRNGGIEKTGAMPDGKQLERLADLYTARGTDGYPSGQSDESRVSVFQR